MNLLVRLNEWRDPGKWDEAPSEEQVLEQLVYCAIEDYLESEIEDVSEFVDAYVVAQ